MRSLPSDSLSGNGCDQVPSPMEDVAFLQALHPQSVGRLREFRPGSACTHTQMVFLGGKRLHEPLRYHCDLASGVHSGLELLWAGTDDYADLCFCLGCFRSHVRPDDIRSFCGVDLSPKSADSTRLHRLSQEK